MALGDFGEPKLIWGGFGEPWGCFGDVLGGFGRLWAALGRLRGGFAENEEAAQKKPTFLLYLGGPTRDCHLFELGFFERVRP